MKKTWLIIVALVAALLLVSCGGSSSETASSSKEKNSEVSKPVASGSSDKLTSQESSSSESTSGTLPSGNGSDSVSDSASSNLSSGELSGSSAASSSGDTSSPAESSADPVSSSAQPASSSAKPVSSDPLTPSASTPVPSSSPAVSSGEESATTSVEEKNNILYAEIVSKTNNYTVTEEGEGTVSIKGKKKPAAGDTVTVKIPDQHYLKIENKYYGTTIVYLSDCEFKYVYASNSSVFMHNYFIQAVFNFTFSIPTSEELQTVRNVALNPYDYDKDTVGFPHATTNNVYDQSGQFIARNAIDGFSVNTAHGNYPYQSWGPKSTVKSTDYFTIDFGREVAVSSVVLALRADGFGGNNSHDAYFSKIVLEFSDGSSVTVNPTKVKDLQTFEFDVVTTSYVKLTGFVTDKSNSQGWAAITEIIVNGCDIIPE